MRPTLIFRLLLGAFLVLSPVAPAAADSTPEAQRWLEKLVSIYERVPFTFDYEADLDMSGIGQPMAGTIAGNIAQADRTRSRMEAQLDLMAAAGGGERMSMSMLTVNDGTTVWTEMTNPAFGTQVTKVSLEVLAQASGTAGFGVSPKGMDPVAQLEALSRTMDFTVVGQADGKVTLEGKVTEAARSELPLVADSGVEGFIFVIDEKTHFPIEVRAEGEKPFMTMRFSNLKFGDSLADELFVYTPPEGLPVTDLGPLLQGQK